MSGMYCMSNLFNCIGREGGGTSCDMRYKHISHTGRSSDSHWSHMLNPWPWKPAEYRSLLEGGGPTLCSNRNQFDSFAGDEVQSFIHIGDLMDSHFSSFWFGQTFPYRERQFISWIIILHHAQHHTALRWPKQVHNYFYFTLIPDSNQQACSMQILF